MLPGQRRELWIRSARRSDNDTVYLIQSWMAERLLPDVDTLKPQKVE